MILYKAYCVTNKYLIIGGEFNCILNPSIDKIGGNKIYATQGSEQIIDIGQDFQ